MKAFLIRNPQTRAIRSQDQFVPNFNADPTDLAADGPVPFEPDRVSSSRVFLARAFRRAYGRVALSIDFMHLLWAFVWMLHILWAQHYVRYDL